MLLMEWNWDDAREVWREEGLEEGVAKGRGEQGAELLAMIEAGCGVEEIRERLVAESGA